MGQSTPIFEASAAELSRNFGHWQDRAMQGPVRVTHHGRPRAVLMSVDAYEALGEGAGSLPRADIAVLEAAAALRAMLNGMNEGFIALDDQLHITAVNPVVEAYLEVSESELLGQPVASLEGGERAAVFVDRFRWVLRTGEPASFVAKTFLGDGERTLAVRAFPYRHGVGVIYQNITEQEALREQLADIEAESAALAEHDEIGVATLNVLGFFTRSNPALQRMLGFSDAQLGELRLSDMVRPPERPAFAQGMNGLLQYQTARFATCAELLGRDGARFTARLSMTRRVRNQVCAGFAAVIVPREALAG